MVRFIVIALTVFGASKLLASFLPSLGLVAFAVFGFGVTWLFLACTTVGVLTYRVTK